MAEQLLPERRGHGGDLPQGADAAHVVHVDLEDVDDCALDHFAAAFDKDTGELLWETTLPFAGTATPITYAVDGRQFVVIAAGGRRVEPTGGVYVAFALPDVPR
jgi:outer membrane protein assembly factor BamB